MAFVETKQVTGEREFPMHASDDAAAFVICKSPDKLGRLVNALAPGKHVHYVSDGDWSTHDLIALLLKKLSPAELYITTYAIREFSVRQLVMALDQKQLISVKMLVDYRAKVRTPEVYQLAAHAMTQIALTSIHAKVVVLRSNKGSVAIVGSSNLTSNPRVEVGVISMSNEVADFHISWIEKLLENAEIFK